MQGHGYFHLSFVGFAAHREQSGFAVDAHTIERFGDGISARCLVVFRENVYRRVVADNGECGGGVFFAVEQDVAIAAACLLVAEVELCRLAEHFYAVDNDGACALVDDGNTACFGSVGEQLSFGKHGLGKFCSAQADGSSAGGEPEGESVGGGHGVGFVDGQGEPVFIVALFHIVAGVEAGFGMACCKVVGFFGGGNFFQHTLAHVYKMVFHFAVEGKRTLYVAFYAILFVVGILKRMVETHCNGLLRFVEGSILGVAHHCDGVYVDGNGVGTVVRSF